MPEDIRPATTADIPALVELLRLLFAIEVDFTFCESRQRRGLELLLATPTARVVVAESDNRTIAMATAQMSISTAEGGPALTIEDVVVAPPFRGRGLGRRLLAELATWGQTLGAQRLQLLADKNNESALAFYRKLGWKETQLICLRTGPASKL